MRSWQLGAIGVAVVCQGYAGFAVSADEPTAPQADKPPLLLVPPAGGTAAEKSPSESDGTTRATSVLGNVRAAAEPPDAFTPSAEFQEWITGVAREQLPETYEKRKNWGHTAKTFDGVSVRIEDGKIKTHRKYKQANDGQWQHYRIRLRQPEETFEIKVYNIRKLGEGKVGLEVSAVMDVDVFGRQSLWQHGVQIYSLSAEAAARVRLWAQVEIATHLNLTRFPPDVSLDPVVTKARFDVPDFRIRRIGELHGPLVRSLSHATREALEDKLAEDNEKLVSKLNRAIAKQQKKLKLSLADLMRSRWSGLVGEGAAALGEPAQ